MQEPELTLAVGPKIHLPWFRKVLYYFLEFASELCDQIQFQSHMTIATETRLRGQNRFFFVVVGKNLFLHVVIMKKVTDRGFLAIWPFENERKFRRKCKNAAKNLKFDKKWVLPSQTPWNIRTYHHHTSYYADHQFLISNTNHFVV